MKWVQARKNEKISDCAKRFSCVCLQSKVPQFFLKILSRIVLFEKFFWKINNWRVKQTLIVAAKDVSNERERERERIAANTLNDNFF